MSLTFDIIINEDFFTRFEWNFDSNLKISCIYSVLLHIHTSYLATNSYANFVFPLSVSSHSLAGWGDNLIKCPAPRWDRPITCSKSCYPTLINIMAVLMTLDAQFYKIENIIKLLGDMCFGIIISSWLTLSSFIGTPSILYIDVKKLVVYI